MPIASIDPAVSTIGTDAPSARHRVLLVDADPTQADIKRLIEGESDLSCCGAVASAEEAIAEFVRFKPDLVVTDLALPRRNGLDLIKDLRAQAPSVPVLVYSISDELLYAERALRAGARGYVMKNAGPKALLVAVRRVVAGHVSVSAQVSAKILRSFSGVPAPASSSQIEGLTDREFEVYRLIGEGKSSKEIASQLGLSHKTVAVHRGTIRKKLGLASAATLVRHASHWAARREEA